MKKVGPTKNLFLALLICLWVISIITIAPAEATIINFDNSTGVGITFADMNLIKGINILVYQANGTLVGEYRSTDTLILDQNQSYLFVLKPTDQSWFTSAGGTVDVLGAYLPLTVNYLIAGIFILGIAYAISRLWK